MSHLKMVIRQSIKIARAAGTVIGFVLLVLFEFLKMIWKMATSTSSAPEVEPAIFSQVKAPDPKSVPTPMPNPVSKEGIVNPEDKRLPVLDLAELNRFSGSSSFRSFVKGGQTVDMRLHLGDTPRIESVLKVPRERLHWMRSKTDVSNRVQLPLFTPEIAKRVGLAFSFDGAQSFLASASLKAIVVVEQKPGSTRPLDHVSSIPNTRLEQSADDQDASASVEVTGTVVSAGQSTVSPKGKKTYTTFTVVISNSSGEVSMSGVELKEKFEDNVFGIGDYVSIKKVRVEFSVDQKKRTKNSYLVTMLKRASS